MSRHKTSASSQVVAPRAGADCCCVPFSVGFLVCDLPTVGEAEAEAEDEKVFQVPEDLKRKAAVCHLLENLQDL